VREARELGSPPKASRLTPGALLEELDLQEDRLHYKIVMGAGPNTGWVSVKLKGKDLVVRTEKVPPNKFDPYAILGIPYDATDAVIKSAFRKASVKCHPDRNPDDPEAAEKFRELTRAKEFLLDPLKRLFYNAKHKLIKPKVNTIWWSDWDEIFEEIDAAEDADEDSARVMPNAGPAHSLADVRTDILVMGATGMTGTMACMVLQKDRASRLTWAIAGRDGRKLERLQERFGRGVRFRGAARAETAADLEALARSARVVVDFRGPMYQVGPELAEACMRAGTHYLMNTGDSIFSKALRERLHGAALEVGACILIGAGILNQLAEFGTWYVVKHLREQHGLSTRRVDMYTHAIGQMFSGSMIATGLARDRKQVERETEEGGGPFFLGGVRPGGPRPEDRDAKEATQDPYSGMWAMPTETPEAPCVRCSCGLFDGSQPWGNQFLFKAWTLFPDKLAAEQSLIFGEFARRFYKKNLEEKKLPPQGAGPNERLRQECFLTMVFVAAAEASAASAGGEPPPVVHCVLRAGPGGMADRFEGSATVALEAAACLLDAADSGHMGVLHGGWGTPTWHLTHLAYFERLVAKGFHFKVVDDRPAPDYFKNLVASTLPIGDSGE